MNDQTKINQTETINEVKIVDQKPDQHIPLLEQLKKASQGNYGVIIIIFIILLIFIFYKSPTKQN